MSEKTLLPVPVYAPNALLAKELITTELRYFADRSLYDAMSTLFVRGGLLTKRFQRNYTLESVQNAAAGSPYELCPDIDEVSAMPEYAIAALHNIVNGHWEPIYSGIRDSYLLVNKETDNVEVYLDLQTSENNGIVNVVAYGLIKSCNYLLQLFQQHFTLKVERSANASSSLLTVAWVAPPSPWLIRRSTRRTSTRTSTTPRKSCWTAGSNQARAAWCSSARPVVASPPTCPRCSLTAATTSWRS